MRVRERMRVKVRMKVRGGVAEIDGAIHLIVGGAVTAGVRFEGDDQDDGSRG